MQRCFLLLLVAAAMALGFNPVDSSASPSYGLFLGREYLQFSTVVMLNPSRTAYWECWVRGVDASTIQQFQVRTPLAATVTIPSVGQGAYLTRDFAADALRSLTFPDGDYQAALTQIGGGTTSVTLSQQSGAYPLVPSLDPFSVLQQLPPGQDLDLHWVPAADALASDFVVVTLWSGNSILAYSTPWPGELGALTGLANHVVIPGSLLQPYSGFMLRITAYRPVSTAVLPAGAGTRVSGRCSTVMTTLSIGAPRAGELMEYRLVRGRVYGQSGDVAPLLSAKGSFFEASATAIPVNHMTNVVVKAPGGLTMELAGLGSADWGFSTNLVSDAAVLAAFPNGSYSWTAGISAGEAQHVSQTLGAESFPAPLQVLGWRTLQTNSLAADVVVRWIRPPGARSKDRIELVVYNGEDVVFRAPDHSVGEAAVAGDATELVIPADALDPYAVNDARLRYTRVTALDSNSLANAVGVIGAAAETRFLIGTLDSYPLELISTPLDDASVGEMYAAPITTGGGREPFVWTLTSGRLPSGLSFDPKEALVSGTPLEAGSFPFSLRVADVLGNTATQNFSLSVTGALAPLVIATTNLPAVEDGRFYLQELVADGGLPPWRWSLVGGPLPDGLSLDEWSGVISGISEQPGIFSLSVELRDAAGGLARRNLALNVPSVSRNPVLRLHSPAVNSRGRLESGIRGQLGIGCTVESSADLVSWTPVLVTNVPLSGVLDLGPLSGGVRFYRAVWGSPGPDPDPITVVPASDTLRTVRATLSSLPLVLSLTNSAGQIWRLELPADAAYAETAIEMSPLQQVGGWPLSAGLLGGVQFKPEGLLLRRVGTLTAVFPSKLAADSGGFAFGADGADFHLYPTDLGSNILVFPIQHFSGYGGGVVTLKDKQSMQQHASCLTRSQIESAVALKGDRMLYDAVGLSLLMGAYTDMIQPKLKASQQDDNRIGDVEEGFLFWSGLMSESIARASGDEAKAAALQMLVEGWTGLADSYVNGVLRAQVACFNQHRPWRMMRLYELGNRANEIGLAEISIGNTTLSFSTLAEASLFERFRRGFRFELEVTSSIEFKADKGGYFKSDVKSGRAVLQPSAAPASRHLYDTFVPSFADLYNTAWNLRQKQGRVKPVRQKGVLGAVAMTVSGLNWQDKTDACGRQVQLSADPLDIRIWCKFDAVDPVPRMLVRDSKGNWKNAPCTTWWEEFKLVHAMEVKTVTDLGGARRVVVQPPEDKWDYQAGEVFAKITYTGTPTVAAGAKGGTVTEDTTLVIHHSPQPLRPNEKPSP